MNMPEEPPLPDAEAFPTAQPTQSREEANGTYRLPAVEATETSTSQRAPVHRQRKMRNKNIYDEETQLSVDDIRRAHENYVEHHCAIP